MAWLMRGKVKSEKTKNKTQEKTDFGFVGLHKVRCRQYLIKRREQENFIPAYEITTVFDFDSQSTLASHLGSGVIMSFLCQPV